MSNEYNDYINSRYQFCTSLNNNHNNNNFLSALKLLIDMPFNLNYVYIYKMLR